MLLSRKGARKVIGPQGEVRWGIGGRAAWLKKRGLKEVWEAREWSRRIFSAWRLWTDKAGPGKPRKREVEEHGQVRKVRGREEASAGEGFVAFVRWVMAGAMAEWRAWWLAGRDPNQWVDRLGVARARCRLVRHFGMRVLTLTRGGIGSRLKGRRKRRVIKGRWQRWLPD